MAKGKTVNFRLDRDLEPAIAAWLEKNPAFDMTTLNNMALRDFITKAHVLEPVEIVIATDTQVLDAVIRVEREHADAIEKLK